MIFIKVYVWIKVKFFEVLFFIEFEKFSSRVSSHQVKWRTSLNIGAHAKTILKLGMPSRAFLCYTSYSD